VKRTQIYIEDEQDARLEQRARAVGATKSQLIREAIDAFIGRPRRRRELEEALAETAGAIPDLRTPDRSEWDRGFG
jgi:predicted DNA-binding protein